MSFNLLMSKQGFQTKLEPALTPSNLEKGQILLEIDKIALTANVVRFVQKLAWGEANEKVLVDKLRNVRGVAGIL